MDLLTSCCKYYLLPELSHKNALNSKIFMSKSNSYHVPCCNISICSKEKVWRSKVEKV